MQIDMRQMKVELSNSYGLQWNMQIIQKYASTDQSEWSIPENIVIKSD